MMLLINLFFTSHALMSRSEGIEFTMTVKLFTNINAENSSFAVIPKIDCL